MLGLNNQDEENSLLLSKKCIIFRYALILMIILVFIMEMKNIQHKNTN